MLKGSLTPDLVGNHVIVSGISAACRSDGHFSMFLSQQNCVWETTISRHARMRHGENFSFFFCLLSKQIPAQAVMIQACFSSVFEYSTL